MLVPRVFLTLALAGALGTSLVRAADVAAPADRIWAGDHILTMTDDNPHAEAIAIRDGRIIAVGSRDSVFQHRGPETAVVELGEQALLPGFVDAHGHAFMIGIQALSANLLSPPDGGVNSIASLQDTLRQWSQSNPDREKSLGMILGFGYDDAQLAEQRHPTRQDLDAVSTDLPVLVIHQSGHIGVVNSKALELLGIQADTPDPSGGVIRREADSKQPNGVLEEAAFFGNLAMQFGRLDAQSAQALFVAGTKLLASYGYTTGQEGRATHGLVPLMKEAAAQGRIPIEVVTYIDVMDDRDQTAQLARREYVNGFRVGGAKLTIDGSPQGFTAFRDRPYYRPPAEHRADYRGYSAVTPDQVFDAVEWAFENDVQIITHANGEAASDLLISAVHQAEQGHGKADRRPVLIHGQILRRDQVAALDRLDIFPSLFPMHTFYWGDWHRDRTVGPRRAD
ncbi:MAG: amidohydrolase, partial [Pigmentiphaga sp.]